MSIIESDRLASDAAEITHKHPLGFIPAALVAHIIYRLGLDSNPTCQSLENYIHEGMTTIKILYPSYPYDVEYMGKLVEKAILLAGNNKPDVENIESIGGGWTGDEALAIALYCAIRHFNNFENALIAAVNHAGDSDSTGAITGNILGAAIGYEAIPEFFKDDLELHEVILHMADDLYRGEVTTIK
jgi:ADP-ribosylglycohydrolase